MAEWNTPARNAAINKGPCDQKAQWVFGRCWQGQHRSRGCSPTDLHGGRLRSSLMDVFCGSWAVFAAAFAARPVYLRKLPTCCTVQVGGVEPNRLCAAPTSHPGSQVQGSPLGQPIKTCVRRYQCRSGCDRSCPPPQSFPGDVRFTRQDVNSLIIH
jgi:hypothetical protein